MVCSIKQSTKLKDIHCTIVLLNMQLYCTYIGSALAMKCTHTPELRLCALLAIRGGCKERTERQWSKIYSVRQKLHKGKVSRQEPVAAEPPGTPSCALSDTVDGKPGHQVHTMYVQGHPNVLSGTLFMESQDTKCRKYNSRDNQL